MAAEYLERMGARIRERRLELGLSRSDVARDMPGKTNENAIYRWEKGLHRPQDDALEALATVLKVAGPEYFLVEEAADTGAAPDLLGALVPKDARDRLELAAVLQRLEERVEELHAKVDELAERLVDPAFGTGTFLLDAMRALSPNLGRDEFDPERADADVKAGFELLGQGLLEAAQALPRAEEAGHESRAARGRPRKAAARGAA